jgi:site-specific DNA-cytosine methylase
MGTGGNNVPVIGFSHTQGLSAQPSQDAWPTLRTEGNGMAVAIPTQQAVNDVAGCLRSGGDGGVPSSRGEHLVVAFDGYNQTISDVSQTIRADKSDGDHVGMVLEAVAHVAAGFKVGQGAGAHSVGYEEEMSSTIPADAGGNKAGVLTPTMAVRRLTPLECERLMGWPDDWTAGQSDTHRYKQCGNGVASPVATWIGQQLMATATDASTTDAD